MTSAIHYVTIPVKVEVDAFHEEETVPEPQAVWIRVPVGAGVRMRVDKAGRSWMDIHELVIVDSQKEAWDEVEAQLKDADAEILDGAREARREMV